MRLETDYGTFEADTEKELLRLARKGLTKAKKEQAKRDADYKRASEIAQSAGYSILVRMARGENFPSAWTLHDPSTDQYRLFKRDGRADTLRYGGPQGNSTHEHWAYRVIGVVENGAGFDLLVFLKHIDRDRGTDDECFAIGVYGETVAFASIPLTLERFYELSESKHNATAIG